MRPVGGGISKMMEFAPGWFWMEVERGVCVVSVVGSRGLGALGGGGVGGWGVWELVGGVNGLPVGGGELWAGSVGGVGGGGLG